MTSPSAESFFNSHRCALSVHQWYQFYLPHIELAWAMIVGSDNGKRFRAHGKALNVCGLFISVSASPKPSYRTTGDTSTVGLTTVWHAQKYYLCRDGEEAHFP